MKVLARAVDLLRNEGLKPFLGHGCRFIGNRLIRSHDIDRKSAIIERYSETDRYLNVGGGEFVKEDWRVLDYDTDWYDYDPILIDYELDLEARTQWPIESDSYDIVYSSHTLEHLTDETVEHVLEEAYRVLRPGGTIRLNVPDASLAIRHYEQDHLDWFENVWLETYTESVYFAEDKCPGYELEFYLLSYFATYLARVRFAETDFATVRADFQTMDHREFLTEYSTRIRDEWQQRYPGWHRNWFTAARLRALLEATGFDDITETNCRQSNHPELCTTHFDNRPHMSVFAEAKKP